MNRKHFIQHTATAAALYPFINALQSCAHSATGKNPILVVIQLVGGNDGLNTLIPLDNYNLFAAARPNLFIPENKILNLRGASACGLHPSLELFRDLYNNHQLTLVQGVGYENQNYSHFRSQDIYLTGSDAHETLYTGWMGRYLETCFPGYPEGFPNSRNPHPPAIKVGDSGSFLFEGSVMDMSMVIDSSSDFNIPGTDLENELPKSYAAAEIKNIRSILKQSKRYEPALQKALQKKTGQRHGYPVPGTNPLADQLSVVARLIEAGLQTSVYHTDLKGFDTHAEQVDSHNTVKGEHARLLAQVSEAVHCFWEDMHRLGCEQQVSGMIFSEFGRRIVSNAAYGTDHGSSQPFLFFGYQQQSGIVGNNPVIPNHPTAMDNLPMQYSFRDIFASVLKGKMKAEASVIQKVLPGSSATLQIFGKS